MVLSKRQQKALELVHEGYEYGLDIMEASGGVISRVALYITLASLEEAGLIEGHTPEPIDGVIQRRMYRITDAGKKACMEMWTQ